MTPAITISVPPLYGHSEISISERRLSRSAQVSGAVGGAGSAPAPPAGLGKPGSTQDVGSTIAEKVLEFVDHLAGCMPASKALLFIPTVLTCSGFELSHPDRDRMQMKLNYANIDPELLVGLARQPPGLDNLTRQTVVQVRAARAALFQPTVDTPVLTTEHQLPTPTGRVRVLVYRAPASGLTQGVLWIHGGGYVLGTAEDDRARLIAESLNATVISVDYRLAPEHPFPAGLEDCNAALCWMFEEASELAIDPNRIAIAGQSGGGGMAAGLALLHRERAGPELALQLLLYPMIDNLHDTPSGAIEDHPVWNRKTSLDAWEMYLDGVPGTDASPYAAAARATDLAGLPPTYICVGTEDLFRDECFYYAHRLMRSGVPTELAVFPGLYHGGDLFVPEARISRRLQSSFLKALADARA